MKLQLPALELRRGPIALRPLCIATDVPALWEVSSGQAITRGAYATLAYDAYAEIWRFMTSAAPIASEAMLAAWLGEQVEAVDGTPFCITLDDAPVGVINYLAHAPQHLRVELGSIWLGRLAQGQGVNRTACYLLLAHAFGLGYGRVEWKCDARNQRSRRAALAMGFRFEGLFANHMRVRGERRDTAWYRIIDSEWPLVAARWRWGR